MNRKDKKGQITIFIIIAILIISVVLLFFVFRENLGISGLSPEIESVNTYIKSCIRETGKDAILSVIGNGGYFLSPQISNTEGIPYYYYNKKSYMPTKEKIEREISLYMNSILPFCINNFEKFSSFNITEGEINTQTKINEEEVVFNVKYPIRIKKGEEKSFLIKDFKNIKINVDILTVYNLIKEMIENQIQRGNEEICISCITSLATENNLIVDITSSEDGIIFAVRDENQLIKKAPLKWRFANYYS